MHEALAKELINIGALAESIKPEVEKELGEEVKLAAISMAIRRYIENEKQFYKKVQLSKQSSLLIKSNLFEISVLKSTTIYSKLIKLYETVNFEQNDTLNIIQGNYEILVISNEQYKEKFLEILKEEKIKKITKDISSISIKIPKENMDQPGFYYAITKTLTLENIPITDIVNTETEATLILKDKHISKAYDLLKKEITTEYHKEKK
ncbi:MAG: hypothetical protein KKF65_03885 [Nanoarchaeota archaeon]|nr:hypothetical protein [Nanoarchaeota archaeon]